jgi:hypothetical protein
MEGMAENACFVSLLPLTASGKIGLDLMIGAADWHPCNQCDCGLDHAASDDDMDNAS